MSQFETYFYGGLTAKNCRCLIIVTAAARRLWWYFPLDYQQSGGRLQSRSAQSADWAARGRLRKQPPGLDGSWTADYSLPEGEIPNLAL